MSAWAATLAFLLGLPFSVWLLANITAVVDEPDKAKPLVRLALSICLVLVVLLVTDRALLSVLIAAFSIVTLLHLGAFYLMRKRMLGAPIYEEEPPDIPLIEEEAREG